MKRMFGDDYKNVLNNTSSFEMEDIGGNIGSMLQNMETAIVEYNKSTELLGKNNCHGAAIGLIKDGRVNPTGGTDDPDGFYLKECKNVSNLRLGDAIRYGSDPLKKLVPQHSTVFLLKNKTGIQVFTKNGGFYSQPYTIMYQQTMLDLNPFYGMPAGLSHDGFNLGSGQGYIIDTPYYRKK